MNALQMLDSKYLRSVQFGVDLPKEPILTIAGVDSTTEQGDAGADERWWLIRFKEIEKPLKLINTNVRCLIACWGAETDAWIGKRVQFYAMPGTWFGERQTAVRIKAAEMAQAVSVPIKMRAKKGEKRKLVYEIAALPGGASSGKAPAAPAPVLDPAVSVIFRKSPHYGKPLAELARPELGALEKLGAEQSTNTALTPEQRARLDVALAAIRSRLAAAPVENRASSSATQDPISESAPLEPREKEAQAVMSAGLGGLFELEAELTAAGVAFDAKQLAAGGVYETEKRAELKAKTAATAPAAPASPPAPSGPVLIFGPQERRGTAIADLGGVELAELIGLGEAKIASLAADKRPPVRACLDAMIAEKGKREAAMLGDGPEPGSDG